jgi:predicted membrane protein
MVDALGIIVDRHPKKRPKKKVDKWVSVPIIPIYFINDTTVHGPKTKDEWLGAIQTMECYLGLDKNHKLRKYIHDIFIDVNDLIINNK